MHDVRPDLTDEPLAVRTLYPRTDDYTMSARETALERTDHLREASFDTLVIRDTDLDGLGFEVAVRKALPDASIATVPLGYDIALDVFRDTLAQHVDDNTRVIIGDQNPDEDSVEAFMDIVELSDDTTVVDHHEWNESAWDAIQATDVGLVHDTSKCTAELGVGHFFDSPPTGLQEFAELVGVRDLWKDDDERKPAADDLALLAYGTSEERFVELARMYTDTILEAEEAQERISEIREREQQKHDLAVQRARMTTVGEEEEGGVTLATTYGRCDSSEVGETLYTGEADVVAIVRPTGSISFRSSDGTDYALQLASALGGGGHPPAAGAKPPVVPNAVSYRTHWSSKGEAVRGEIERLAAALF